MEKNNKELFIRFGEIPEDGKSLVYNEDGIICGKRRGVSVYGCVETPYGYAPLLPIPYTQKAFQEFCRYTLQNDGTKRAFLVSGILIDKDENGCPIIENPEILEELDLNHFREYSC